MRGRDNPGTAPRDEAEDHTRFRSRPRRFTVTETREAWLVTADNLDEVAVWCGGTVYRYADHPDMNGVDYPIEPNQYGETTRTADVGDVIVRDGDRYYDVPEWLFERDCASKWTEVDQLPPEPEKPVYGVLTGKPLRVTRR